jgi:hypothetical protein
MSNLCFLLGPHSFRTNRKLKKFNTHVDCLARTMMYVLHTKHKSDHNNLQRSMHGFDLKIKNTFVTQLFISNYPAPHATDFKQNLTPDFCSEGKLRNKIKSSKSHTNHT